MKFASVASAAALALSLAVSSASAADVTMRISLQLPLKSHLGQNLVLFEKEVEKRSNGEIDVEIYDSAQLYKDKEVPAAVGSGAIEAGVASLTRYVGDIPAVDIFYMPFLFNTEEKVRAAVAPGSPCAARSTRRSRTPVPRSCGGRPMAAPSCSRTAARLRPRLT